MNYSWQSMKLLVHAHEARGLPAMDLNGLSDPYVRLQLGRLRAKSKVVKESLNPTWDEKFSFLVGDLGDDLVVSVIDEDKYSIDDFIGQVKVPLLQVFDAENQSLGSAWYQLQPKNKKSKNRDYGEIRLTISLPQNNSCLEETSIAAQSFSDEIASNSNKSFDLIRLSSLTSNEKMVSSSVVEVKKPEPVTEEKLDKPSFVERLFQFFPGKNVDIPVSSSRDLDPVEDLPVTQGEHDPCDNQADDVGSNLIFDELLDTMESKDKGEEMPGSLTGGVLIDQSYVVAPGDLNSLIFSPSSDFLPSLAKLQGTTVLQTEPWRLKNDGESLKRVVTYTMAATKLVKSVKATEEQTYLKAGRKVYAVLVSVSIPGVPFGNYFKTEILFCITPGPELPSGDQISHLVVSWHVNFLQSTMMKGMIVNGVRQGLKDSYAQFSNLLSQNVKPVALQDYGSSKEQILDSLQTEKESYWKLAFRYFGNFTVISSVCVALYFLAHILLAKSNTIQGLEFVGLDLPDSIEEVVVSGVLVLQGERVLKMIARFLQARKLRGGDHGIKAQGDGWLLTVALIEGSNLAAMDSSGSSDPFVVLTCIGKTKTSSIKFQRLDPQWNEIFEFDAMNDPPSVMDVDVYDFDGPFDEATSLGHAEVNFVKSSLSELADIWIPLQGKLAQACQSKLHLRVFLNNTRGTAVATEYLTKMEKEVGKKINLRSPQANSAFQKLFALPPEEFLINDFTCHLKRKMPMQGRLFLSPRIIGFHANLFGHKTNFYFLWEDIDDIQVIPPSLASMGSPSLMIILCQGRGLDAKHGAKAHENGRLKFHFQSFVSFNVAHRTIMALWKARSLSLEQKVQIVDEQSEERTLHSEISGSFIGIEDAKLSEVYSTSVSVAIYSLMKLFEGGSFEQRVMEKTGCIDHSVTPWEPVKPEVSQRQINYKLDKKSSPCEGEVTSTQQKSPLPDRTGWVIEEVMTLQGVLLGDYFNLHLRYQIEDLPSKSKACSVQVSLGIAWLKSTRHRKRITKNVLSNSSTRLREMFHQAEEIAAGS